MGDVCADEETVCEGLGEDVGCAGGGGAVVGVGVAVGRGEGVGDAG